MDISSMRRLELTLSTLLEMSHLKFVNLDMDGQHFYRYYRPGVDLRMNGDGEDQVEEIQNATNVTFPLTNLHKYNLILIDTSERENGSGSRFGSGR